MVNKIKCNKLWFLCRIFSNFIPVLFYFTGNVFGQTITSVEPSTVYPGQQHATIKISGIGTSFASEKTDVDMGPEISVTGITVQSTVTMLVVINVSPSAIAGPYNVTVTTKTNTGNQVLTLPDGINVVASGGPVHATIFVNPVQSIHLADFNPTSIADAPLLFTVTLYNNNTVQDLTVVATVSGQKLGLIATGTKTYKALPAYAVETLDNRQFDTYSLGDISEEAIQNAIQTGSLPSDVYEYNVKVLIGKKVVATTAGANTITDQLSQPELISPGNPLYSDPPLVNNRFPVFQWYCQAHSFDFNLYQVKPGQKSSPEIVLNRPTYTQTNISPTSLIYPNAAPLLEDGQTYAWQIVAKYTSSSGPVSVAGDLFWFTVATSPATIKTQTVSELKVVPTEITILAGQTYTFSVKTWDIENDTLAIRPTWRVIPKAGGTVDENGKFTAGARAMPVAVVATYHGISAYATVDIKNPKQNGIGKDSAKPSETDTTNNKNIK